MMNEEMNLTYLDLKEMASRVRSDRLLPFGDRTLLGAWMPAMLGGRLVERAFLYNTPMGGAAQPRPFAWLTVDSLTGVLAQFSYCIAWDFMDTAAYPLDATLAPDDRPLEARMQSGKALAAAYRACRSFLLKDPASLTGEEKQLTAQLKQAVDAAFAPQWLPYYKALGDQFYAWLDQV